MAHKTPLSATFAKTVNEPGVYGEGRGGHGLHLRVYRRADGRLAKSWGQRIAIRGRITNLGLGTFPLVTLAEARRKALANRRETAQGRDPRGGGVPTFAEASEKVIALHAGGWKDPAMSARAWRATFRDYAAPFASKPVSKVTSGDILEALAPVWNVKPSAAKTARQRIGAVLKWAIASGHRADNPAGEALTSALPRQNGINRHHAALPHGEVAGALAKVRSAESRGKAARLSFEFAALTACRSVEARGARWHEVDREARVWIIPAARMKAKRAHRIPLADAALDVLRQARNLGSGIYVFPSPVKGRELSGPTLQKLARMCGGTVHGLRTSFRTWCGDTGVAREVAEAALAHVVGGVEGAYNRTDLFERRREVMDNWGSYIG